MYELRSMSSNEFADSELGLVAHRAEQVVLRSQIVQWASRLSNQHVADVSVDLGRFHRSMPEQRLNDSQVDSSLQQVGGE